MHVLAEDKGENDLRAFIFRALFCATARAELARYEARPRRSRVRSALLTDGSERCRVPPVASRPGTCPTRTLSARVNFCAAPLADFPTREGQAPVVVLGTNSARLQQLSSGNPVYEKYYRQVDTGNTGRVLASDAAAFLKKSGLPALILGKIWDLADTDGKGVLSKQEFFIALRLVACAQNGLEVSLSSLNLAVPPPRFHDSSSPLLTSGTSAAELPWAVKSEDKAKYDVIFDSLSPVDGFLSGDKVKPVLLNSKLPVEILGRVWELSDIDHDGKLDRDEFAVAMFLVYCALEKEPVPMSLPPALVPPSKRKTWVVSPAEKAKYDEIFLKTDKDMDGYVSGQEVRETFLKTGLPSALLAHIWALCDTKNCGKLSKDQFALAFHLINQKLIKGIDPPHILSPEMIPPSDRSSLQKTIIGSSPVADFSAIKELDTLNNEIVDLQRYVK
uniref:epidermal growth factor receptor substrate 15-like n=1 Tax=Myodes glareolus TaxID=447135 RepID=UPI00202033E3|nr:epidermal growth factor receptor substrate 15-like [Myodes glareolus]